MKVKELIEKLQTFDPELMVVRPGYEGGVTELGHADVITVALNWNSKWYYGEHEEIGGYGDYANHPQAQVLELK